MENTDFIRVQNEDFDLAAEYEALRHGAPDTGAIVTFTGLVRDFNLGDGIESMSLEHYPGMTEKVLADIVAQAHGRWQLQRIRVIHRVGGLRPGDQIVFVGIGSAHRGDAFAACEYIMDFLKTRAPFWKKEHTTTGSRWVDARESDDTAARRWGKILNRTDEHK